MSGIFGLLNFKVTISFKTYIPGCCASSPTSITRAITAEGATVEEAAAEGATVEEATVEEAAVEEAAAEEAMEEVLLVVFFLIFGAWLLEEEGFVIVRSYLGKEKSENFF
jgi:hypothetical protein